MAGCARAALAALAVLALAGALTPAVATDPTEWTQVGKWVYVVYNAKSNSQAHYEEAVKLCKHRGGELSPYESHDKSCDAIKYLCWGRKDTCWYKKAPVYEHGKRCHLLSQEGHKLLQGCDQKVSYVCRYPHKPQAQKPPSPKPPSPKPPCPKKIYLPSPKPPSPQPPSPKPPCPKKVYDKKPPSPRPPSPHPITPKCKLPWDYKGCDGYCYKVFNAITNSLKEWEDAKYWCEHYDAELSPWGKGLDDTVAAYSKLCHQRKDTCWYNKPPVYEHGKRCHLFSQEGHPLLQGCHQKVSFVCRWKC